MNEVDREDALKNCIDTYYDAILNYFYLRTGNRQDAEDLTQESFLKLAQSIDSFRGESSWKTYVFSIAKHTLTDSYRSKFRVKKLVKRVAQNMRHRKDFDAPSPNTELMLTLDALNEEDRELVILAYYFGYPYKEIAQITGLSETNVGVKLTRIKKSLQSEEGGSLNGLI